MMGHSFVFLLLGSEEGIMNLAHLQAHEKACPSDLERLTRTSVHRIVGGDHVLWNQEPPFTRNLPNHLG